MYLNDHNIYGMEPIVLRRMVGMVFQKPNPFPTMSIYDNVIAGYKLNGIRRPKDEFDNIVEQSLRKSALWDEVKDSSSQKGDLPLRRSATETLYRTGPGNEPGDTPPR